jgi:hypothetical protein
MALACGASALPAAPLEWRWVYCPHNLLVDQNVERLLDVLRRAAAAGYNGALLADFKFNILERMDATYFRNVERVKTAARELGMELIPAVFPIGWSGGILAHNPNLAEGLPVRDAPFVVRADRAVPEDEAIPFLNGDFEEHDGDRFAGWSFQDEPGKITRADTTTVHSGRTALRMERIREHSPQYGNARVQQSVAVRPFRAYHLSVWIKTDAFRAADNVRVAVLTEDGRARNFTDLGVRQTQEWTQHHIVFNSLQDDRVRIYLGVWGGATGTIWWDDARLEPAGLTHLLRRDGCPFVIVGDDGTAYEEARDFVAVRDPRLGEAGFEYHEPPTIALTASSRMRDGERLRVSYYHTVMIGQHQVPASIVEPETYRILRDQAQRVQQALEPPAFFMSHDEIRIANWDAISQATGKTPGELLAENVRRCIGFIREVNPTARVYVWSDMFDPHHNAHDNYYLVNGTWAGSWEGLTPDVIVANWHFGAREKNLRWFAERGHRQILAGYYDSDPANIREWLETARRLDVPVSGVMYTTWQNNYRDLEAFARYAWGVRPASSP